ncbi:isochorismatase domain-containing protein 2 [Orussus abietinus]|uniref:isochorismatase domain-containing protein 2 n=1 Tax=Orussus abietinus TaxID=222816 RepID=UPI000625DDA2|nr:isochorismatase domain-containing protein 2 [Orussus abietinus]XP_012285483.1 isochorismatase domain-containing protein 2 [Orussus abietinus]
MSINAAKAVLKPDSVALLICDVQQKFAKVIYEFDKMLCNSTKLVGALKLLDIPILITEQYPKALGHTVPELAGCATNGPFHKTQFSMYTKEVCTELSKICCGKPPESIILIGIEAHVCVENTAIDLKNNGFEVHTVADCCSSRSQEDRLLAFQRMHQFGCQITTSENVIFKLLKDSKHQHFKEIQKLIQSPSQYTGLATLSKI